MPVYIALFRGINVGGNNKLPMKALIDLLKASGYKNARSYIQSGNIVLESSEAKAKQFESTISKEVEKLYGFRPKILVLSRKEFEKAYKNNPFPQGKKNPKALHLFFLSELPKQVDFEKLNQIKDPTESYELLDRVFYLYAPNGIGRSKLASSVEKVLKVDTTARNWNTIEALLDLMP